MAILKMKKLSVSVISSQKKELLKRLIRLGCVQLDEQEPPASGEEAAALTRVDSSLLTYKNDWARFNRSLEILNRFFPEKNHMLSPPPEVSGEILLDENGLDTLLSRADAIIYAEDRIKRIATEKARQKAIIKSLDPWKSITFNLASDGSRCASVVLGTLAARCSIAALNTELQQVTDKAELIPVSDDKARHYVALICLREELTPVMDALRPMGFQPALFSGMSGTAMECSNRAVLEYGNLASEEITCIGLIEKSITLRKDLQLAADKYQAKIAMAEAEEKLLATESVVFLSGWVPEEKEPELEKLLGDFVCAWETSEPSEEEYDSVPVKLKNNPVTNALNMVTNMYSLPKYGTVDPNPLMAPFFILFYGLMMADMGYGLIMIAAALVALKKMKPQEGSLAFCQLLLWCGISTLAMGALTGSFFSDIPAQLYQVFNPAGSWQGLPYLFSPVYQSEAVLYGSMVLGALHLNTGMVISFIQKRRAGRLADAIWEEGSLWVVLAGGILAVLDIGSIAGVPVLLVVGVAMLLFGAGRNAKGFGKVTAAFACIYNTATGWFGDVLSYSRVMALMLAGGVVGQVFNTVAVMPMKSSGINAVTIAAFVIIFILGHAMNFGLNLLGCYVHDLRLQCLEFFGKFYEDGGKPFKPLKFGSKYVRANENMAKENI